MQTGRGVIVAWNEMVSTQVDARIGQFSVAFKLKRQRDDLEIVMVSIFGPPNARRRGDLWGGTNGDGCSLSRISHADGG